MSRGRRNSPTTVYAGLYGLHDRKLSRLVPLEQVMACRSDGARRLLWGISEQYAPDEVIEPEVSVQLRGCKDDSARRLLLGTSEQFAHREGERA